MPPVRPRNFRGLIWRLAADSIIALGLFMTGFVVCLHSTVDWNIRAVILAFLLWQSVDLLRSSLRVAKLEQRLFGEQT